MTPPPVPGPVTVVVAAAVVVKAAGSVAVEGVHSEVVVAAGVRMGKGNGPLQSIWGTWMACIYRRPNASPFGCG